MPKRNFEILLNLIGKCLTYFSENRSLCYFFFHSLNRFSKSTLTELSILSECRKMWTRKTPNMDTFYAVIFLAVLCNVINYNNFYYIDYSEKNFLSHQGLLNQTHILWSLKSRLLKLEQYFWVKFERNISAIVILHVSMLFTITKLRTMKLMSYLKIVFMVNTDICCPDFRISEELEGYPEIVCLFPRPEVNIKPKIETFESVFRK